MLQEDPMVVATSAPISNRLIASLPRSERERVLAHCEPIDLVFGTILCEPDRPYRDVYFPLHGFISQVEMVRGHPPLEMSLIGNEGMLGATLVLGIPAVPLRAVVQGAGSAWRMSAPHFQRELTNSSNLRQALGRYLYVVMTQLSQVAACTYFHEVGPRLARWLLMTHDRAHSDHFHLTHQFMADMLGVQRSAITIAAGALQKKKLIRYVRGEISILNRRGLEEASCECYASVVKGYSKQFV
jgi:hypothetical protein